MLNPWLAAGLGAVAGGLFYAIARTPDPCEVVWSGPFDDKANGVIWALASHQFNPARGTLKQDVIEPLEGGHQQRMVALLVPAYDIERARAVVARHLVEPDFWMYDDSLMVR